MNKETEFSDELLNAFIDDELDAVEQSRVLDQLLHDDGLRARASELWQVKQLMRGGCALPNGANARRSVAGRSRFRHWQVAAVPLLLAIGAVSGWWAGGLRHEAGMNGASMAMSSTALERGRVVLHLESNDPVRLKAALDEAEDIATARDLKGHPVEVELIANAGGLDLLRADVSPYADRIGQMWHKHSNLTFIACQTAIDNLERKGVTVRLLPEAQLTGSAVEEIVTRVKQGWMYLRV